MRSHCPAKGVRAGEDTTVIREEPILGPAHFGRLLRPCATAGEHVLKSAPVCSRARDVAPHAAHLRLRCLDGSHHLPRGARAPVDGAIGGFRQQHAHDPIDAFDLRLLAHHNEDGRRALLPQVRLGRCIVFAALSKGIGAART